MTNNTNRAPVSSETDQRVAAMAADFETYLAELYAIVDSEDIDEEAREEALETIDESHYGADIQRHLIITLAGGGPSHWLDVKLDDNGDVSDVTSIATWGNGLVKTEPHTDSALWRFAENIAQEVSE
ncbi:hypothetical protein [Frigoribacterium sp. UYMn621]|uniref:hypothetical protein n=1 Tax=Frigoribacterium sp. UYMn621 TaxID=3156343 RepID=UPI00339678A1